MQEKAEKIIQKRFNASRIPNDQREEAFTYLALIGLKHYMTLYSTQEIHLPILEFLTGTTI
jgi:hypothetical protein